ncbi:MAG: hypothetical protein K2O32_14425, partial [Acetatifactor sp.]|nr:hypothetical protein [Acetatifactor sp.]
TINIAASVEEHIFPSSRMSLTRGTLQIALINVCRDVKLSFEETAERVRSGFHLEDAEVQENMRLYW